MSVDQAQQRAIERMALRGPDETRMAQEGQANAGGVRKTDFSGNAYYDSAPLSEYPRMMYRKTDVEEHQPQTDALAKCGATSLITNNYGTPTKPLLCDTMVAEDATEAELMTADGWDISPHAAHGISDGLAKVTSAKDDEIARLRAELAARDTERPKLTPNTKQAA